MSAAAFIDLLAERQIVPNGMIEQLRKQVGSAAKPISAAAVAKALLDKQLLTPHQAQSLLDAAKPPAPAVSKPTPPPAPTKPAPPSSTVPSNEFGLAPLDDDKPAHEPKKPVTAKEPTAKPVAANQAEKPAAPNLKPPPRRPANSKAASPPAVATDDPLFGGGMDDLFGSGALGSDLNGGSLDASDPLSGIDPLGGGALTPTLQSAVAKKSSTKKPWSFWGAIAGSILLLGAVVGIAGTRDNGDGAWAKAQSTIKQSPADTEMVLNSFVAAFPNHAQAGQAQVLLAQLRLKELEKRSGNPRDNARTLLGIVEPIAAEPSLTTVQPQLAKQIPDLLRALLASAAGMDPKNTAGRSEIADIAGKLWALGNDPRVIPYESRTWRSWDEYQETIAQLQREATRAGYAKQLELALSGADVAALKAKLVESLSLYPELAETAEWQAAAKRAGL